MATERDSAVVLRLTEYSETSQVATLFTRGAGLLKLIAKGVRRSTRQRHAVGLDLLELGDVSYAPAKGDAELGTLAEWVQRNPFSGLRRELIRVYSGLYAAELTSGLTEVGDPHPVLYDALVEVLTRLSEDARPDVEIVRFQVAVLRQTGFSPELRTCMGCRRTDLREPMYFSSAAGGVLCRDCEMHHVEKRRLPHALLSQSISAAAGQWYDLLDYHLTHLMGRPAVAAADVARMLEQLESPASDERGAT